ncbi:hypothetical protein GCM10018772_43220 [Streptomyces fumanus]|uniref:Uncharacterized protein n=1 Tax=Streptomyces fumanus TaxID=67302 RepID=A0A919AK78_9ACTN|nr:hypothetical protein GCM10018772_43220 [Streptomyces fumanus]
MPDPETSTTSRLTRSATGLAATVGALSRGSGCLRPVRTAAFVRSYECFAPRDTGKSTKRPAVSNDTGTPDGPLGTGAWPEGSVWSKRGAAAGVAVGAGARRRWCPVLPALAAARSAAADGRRRPRSVTVVVDGGRRRPRSAAWASAVAGTLLVCRAFTSRTRIARSTRPFLFAKGKTLT